MTLRNLDKVRPSVTLDFQKSKKLDPRVTFTRASYADSAGNPIHEPSAGTGTHSGTLQNFNINVPRLTDQGLLIEGGSTNYFRPDTKLIGTGGFASTQVFGITESSTATTQLAPGGSTAVYRYELSNVNESHSLRRVVGGGGATEPGTDWGQDTQNGGLAFSIFVKPDGWTKFILIIQDTGGTQPTLQAAFDLSTNTTGPVEYGWTDNSYSATKMLVEEYGDGWYRLGISVPSPIAFRLGASLIAYDTLPSDFGTKAPQFGSQLFFNSSSGYPEVAFSPGQTGLGFYACFAQVEVGRSCTSYIQCSGTVTTRAADMCDLSLTGWWNSSVQTWTGDFKTNRTALNTAIITILINDNRPLEFVANTGLSGTNKIRIGARTPSQFGYSEQAPADQTGFNKAAGTITASEIQAYVNGNKSPTPTPITLPTGNFTTAHIGYYGDTNNDQYHLNGTISRISFYPTRVSDPALQALTI